MLRSMFSAMSPHSFRDWQKITEGRSYISSIIFRCLKSWAYFVFFYWLPWPLLSSAFWPFDISFYTALALPFFAFSL